MNYFNNPFGYFLELCLLFSLAAQGQHLQVKDFETQTPLEQALVTEETKTLMKIADSLGMVSL